MNQIKTFIFVSMMFFNVSKVYSIPDRIDVIFFSPPKSASILKILKEKNIVSKAFAQASDCTPMGDGCFHPQKGYFSKENIPYKENDEDFEKNKKLRLLNSEEANLITCDKKYYFDLYCGKAQKINKVKTDYEVWVDTSSSMKNVDIETEPGHCGRRLFVQKLQGICPNIRNTDLYVFDTSIKQLSTKDYLCLNYGMNNKDRFIKWIKDSKAKKLLIITDVDEMSQKVREFLDHVGAKVYGGDTEDFNFRHVDMFLKKYGKLCK